MIAETSIESYRQCKANGLISARQLEVIEFATEALVTHPGGFSRGDVGRHFNDTNTGHQRRVQELELAGVLTQRGTKVDEITGKPVKIYSLTGHVPTVKVQSVKKKPSGGPFVKLIVFDANGELAHELPCQTTKVNGRYVLRLPEAATIYPEDAVYMEFTPE